jgi:hypothetical protein
VNPVRKILLIWDVKGKGSPATMFYRALRGYDYPTKSGKNHSSGVLDELPSGSWKFVSKSVIMIDEKHASRVEGVFEEFERHVYWKKFEVREVG